MGYVTKDYYFESGSEGYFICIRGTKEKVKVSQEVFNVLKRSYQNEEKQAQRHPAALLDEENGNSGQKTSQDYGNPEKLYLLRESRRQFYGLLRDNCSVFELELLENLVLDGMTVTDYAKKIGMPRTTLQSKKNALFKRLRKIF